MTTITQQIEIVALATDQAETLDALVERLHGHLRTALADSWTLTIVDYASDDDTFAVAQRLAGRYVSTRARRIPERLERTALRRQWQASESMTVAFLELAPDRDIEQQLAPLTRDARTLSPTADGKRQFTRRHALFAVVLAPEMTEGPYYLDLDLVRSNVVEDRKGAPFALDLVVIDVATQKPIQGAAVDIWHADASGAYSGFVSASASANGGGASGSSSGSDTSTFLRGTQVSDASGKVSFATIYPGWYTGRAVHIHVKVHVSGKEIHTGQLFFDDTFTDTVYASTAPYSSRGARNVRNANDSIYSGGGAQSTLLAQKVSGGYAATTNMGVKSA